MRYGALTGAQGARLIVVLYLTAARALVGAAVHRLTHPKQGARS